jgi:hypothetical protein
VARYKDGTPARAPLPQSFRRSVAEITRCTTRIAKLSDDDRMLRNRKHIADLYLAEVRIAHAQLSEFLSFMEQSQR